MSFSKADRGLLEAGLSGDRRALSRLLSRVADDPFGLLAQTLAADAPSTATVGITGPPGTGKSTLVDALLEHLRREGQHPGVVAVDPSSPFTGGAILGDRIRMQRHSSDEGIYIRSMANRGHPGGLAAGTAPVVATLAKAGFSPILVETVGVGQSELDVMRLVDTVVVVLHPGWGDEVQTAKAGLLEIGHVFVVNKADQGDAEATASRLTHMIDMGTHTRLKPQVVITNALSGEGIAALWEAVTAQRQDSRMS